MKKLRFLLMTVAVICLSMTFQSCLNDDDNTDYGKIYPNALVTVKPVSSTSFYLQLDEKTTLFPTNMTASPFGSKQVRALVNYSEVDKPSQGYTKAIYINWIDSVLTKPIATDLGATENDKVYGTDPVGIINDWVTIAEDGYLTLNFVMISGNSSKAHYVNLLASTDPTKPYEVEFRHNAYGDTYGRETYGLVAFDLNSLPDTGGKTVKLKLKWKSFSGDKTAEFDYTTRKATPAKATVAAQRSVIKLK